MKKWLMTLLMMFAAFQAHAAIEIYQFDQAQQETLYKELTDELRCLVCQNQNLSSSNAGLAYDLRKETYEMVMQGQTREQIVDYMTNRYGDFVMYRPPLKTRTILLWFGPFLLLVVGIIVLMTTLRQRSKENDEPLSSEQHKNIQQLLEKGE